VGDEPGKLIAIHLNAKVPSNQRPTLKRLERLERLEPVDSQAEGDLATAGAKFIS
jgi:hypothetical protein